MNIPNGNENENGCAERMKWCGELSVDIVSQPAKKHNVSYLNVEKLKNPPFSSGQLS